MSAEFGFQIDPKSPVKTYLKFNIWPPPEADALCVEHEDQGDELHHYQQPQQQHQGQRRQRVR
jgi:hypothetical protein